MNLRVEIPIRVSNPLNGSHRHWATVARERKRVRENVLLYMRSALMAEAFSYDLRHFRVTRLAPRMFDPPYDGLLASLKSVVDGLADALGVDDRVLKIKYAQEKSAIYCVRVESME